MNFISGSAQIQIGLVLDSYCFEYINWSGIGFECIKIDLILNSDF